MKRLSLLAIASLAVVGAAQAQTPSKTPEKVPAKISCSVEKGNMVNVADATKKHMYADYKGRRYFLLLRGLPRRVQEGPGEVREDGSEHRHAEEITDGADRK